VTRLLFAIPGDLASLTGGYSYDRRLLQALPACGVKATHVQLPASFPAPGATDVSAAVQRIDEARRPGDVILFDGLAYGAMPEAAIRMLGAPVVALCHHPLHLEAGLDAERRASLSESEATALSLAAHVLTTSEATREQIARDLQVPAARITVAEPGTDSARRAAGAQGSAVRLLAVGSITPRKAFHILVEALADFSELDWRLAIIGGAGLSPPTAEALRNLIEAKGLGQRVELAGELDAERLDEAYHSSDVFVSSSLYEGYGMALAEALARGLPILTTTGGAAGKTVPDAAALKVPPGDVAALRQALRRAISDAALRTRLSDASWSAGRALPRWDDTAQIVAGVIRSVKGSPR
jgi:glycosyltransferase involved in cell wall biosynthesis